MTLHDTMITELMALLVHDFPASFGTSKSHVNLPKGSCSFQKMNPAVTGSINPTALEAQFW